MLPLADYPEPSVKSYPEISLEAMKRRQEPQYRVWLLARHLDKRGAGWCELGDLRSFIGAHGLFTIRTLRRALSPPNPYFHKVGSRVYLASAQKIARSLEVTLRMHPVWIPLADLGSLATLRSVLVASLFAQSPRTIAQETLASLSGRCSRTVRRYLDSHHVHSTQNAMLSRRSPSYRLDPQLAKDGFFHTIVDGDRCLLRRLPNTYQSDLQIAAFGIVKYKRPNTCSPTRRDLARRYFDKAKAAFRAMQSQSPHSTVYLLSPGHRVRSKHRLWLGYTRVPGLEGALPC